MTRAVPGAAQRGRRARRKGADGEREIVALARAAGLAAHRTWQAAQSPEPAARRCDVAIGNFRCQCKRRARLGTVYRWLEGVDVAFLRQDGGEWLALLPAAKLLPLLAAREIPASQ